MAKIQGYVKDADTDNPIQGANVKLERQGAPSPSTTTNSKGYYEFPDGSFWYGTVYTIKASARGYKTESHSITTPKATEVKQLSFHLQKEIQETYARLKVYVEGTPPLKPFTLTAYLIRDGSAVVEKEQREGGNAHGFEFLGDPYSAYKVEVESLYYERVTREGQMRGAGIPNRVEEDITLKEKAKPETGVVQGYVRDPAGNAIEGVTVSINSYTSTTSVEGFYRIEDIPAGTYTLLAQKEGYSHERRSIEVVAGMTKEENIVIHKYIPTSGTFVGTVIAGDTRQPIQNAKITANGYTATTDTQGNYRIENIPARTYNLTCSAEGYETVGIDNVALHAGERRVNFTLNRPVEVELPFMPPETIFDIIMNILSPFFGVLTELLKEATFSWIGLFYWVTHGGQRLETEEQLKQFLDEWYWVFQAGNIVTVPLRGVNVKGEPQKDLELWDYISAAAVFGRWAVESIKLFGQGLAMLLERYGISITEWLAKIPAGLFRAGTPPERVGVFVMGILEKLTRPARAILDVFTMSRWEWEALPPSARVWRGLLAWNVMTDWLWMVVFGKQIYEFITGDKRDRAKSLSIEIGKEMYRIAQAADFAETPEDWAMIKADLLAVKPLIDEFGEILEADDVFGKVGDKLPELRELWDLWTEQYNRLIKTAEKNAEGAVVEKFEEFEAWVIRVNDGDTFVARYKKDEKFFEDTIRLKGIDAPELDYGSEVSRYTARICKAALYSMLKEGDHITLKINPAKPRDDYGRILADVYKRGELINYEMRKYLPGSIQIYTSPTRASLLLNGTPPVGDEVAENLPLGISGQIIRNVPPGTWNIKIYYPGFQTEEITITLNPREAYKHPTTIKLIPVY